MQERTSAEPPREWMFWLVTYGGSVTVGFALCLLAVSAGWIKP